MAMIELEDITKRYQKGDAPVVHALRGVSLAIGRGELVAIAGASGSGKSTLMNVLGLLDRPDGGRYRFDGREVSTLSAREQAGLRNTRIGFVFQAFHLLPRTTALENVELPLVYSDRADIRGLGQRALELVGLADRVAHTPAELSGGQQQRVAIARALVNEPDLMLADEPTGNLDSESAADILATFETLNAAGRTIVIVTHDAAVAARCPRRIRIADGRVVEDTRPLSAGADLANDGGARPALQEVR
jgi:ABC-type lipoprotein export system ATPase subunit